MSRSSRHSRLLSLSTLLTLASVATATETSFTASLRVSAGAFRPWRAASAVGVVHSALSQRQVQAPAVDRVITGNASVASVDASWVLSDTADSLTRVRGSASSTKDTMANASVPGTPLPSSSTCKFTGPSEAHCEEGNAEEIAWAKAWCLDAVQAYVDKAPRQLERCARIAFKRVVSPLTLLHTGIGFLLHDKGVWSLTDKPTQEQVQLTIGRWKEAAKAAGKLKSKFRPAHPLGSKSASFETSVASITEGFRLNVATEVDADVLREAASACAVLGFASFASLGGADITEIQAFHMRPAVTTLVSQLVEAATLWCREQRDAKRRKTHFETLPQAVTVSRASAQEVALSLAPSAVAEAESTLQENLGAADLAEICELPPAAQIAAWAQAREAGHDVLELLGAKSEALRREPLLRNAKSIASGLRAWHSFAVWVLGYCATLTLPPVCSSHVVAFLHMFRNGATGANYVNHIVSGCKAVGASVAWHGAEVLSAKKNALARTTRLFPVFRHEPEILTWALMCSVVASCDSTGDSLTATVLLMWYEFLLRVQSEGLELTAGSENLARSLKAGVHSCCWVGDNVLFIHLARRKHRQCGSTLQRSCACSRVGAAMCVVHRFMQHRFQAGSRIWHLGAYDSLQLVRRLLAKSGAKHPEHFTLKGFRSGKATQMAKDGETLAAILMAGEWRSAAFLRYISETELDREKVLRQALEEDEEESVPLPIL